MSRHDRGILAYVKNNSLAEFAPISGFVLHFSTRVTTLLRQPSMRCTREIADAEPPPGACDERERARQLPGTPLHTTSTLKPTRTHTRESHSCCLCPAHGLPRTQPGSGARARTPPSQARTSPAWHTACLPSHACHLAGGPSLACTTGTRPAEHNALPVSGRWRDS